MKRDIDSQSFSSIATDSIVPASTDALIGDVEEFLREAITHLEPESAPQKRSVGRPRIIPALCLWAGLLVCVLHGFSSQLALWRLLSSYGLWFYPRYAVTDQAVYKRLAQAGTDALERLFEQISALLRARVPISADAQLVPWASEILALDATTIDPVLRKLPPLRGLPAGDARLLPGKLAALFDVRRQQWRRTRYISEPHQNDKVVAADMVADLPRGSLLLADLGYFAFAWFDALTDQGYYWVSRLRAKTSYTPIHIYYEDPTILEALVWLGAYRADHTRHAVRLVRFSQGQHIYTYITNVIDPRQLSAGTIARLYGRRWDIEMAFNLAKTQLKLHLLWSSKPGVILQQVWAVLIISQIILALHQEIAYQARVDPADVSIALLVSSLPEWAARGYDPVTACVEFGRAAHIIRPSHRIVRQAPEIPPDQIRPLPPGIALEHKPRYANRKCGRGTART